MGTLVIKNVSEDLHARLKEQAQRHHRSVTKEVISLVEAGLTVPRPPIALPASIKLKGGPLTIEDIESAITAGRD